MCQQARPWASARDRARDQFGLSKSLATGAGHSRTHDPFHHKVAGDVLPLFRHVFAQRLERTTAIVAAITRREGFFQSLKMIRHRCAILGALAGSVLIRIRFRGCLLRLGGGGNFNIFLQIERQLAHGLRFAAKTGIAMCRQFLLQLIDLIGLRFDFGRHQFTDYTQLDRVFGQGFKRSRVCTFYTRTARSTER